MYGTGTTFGEIKYKVTYEDDFEARLQLHGLKPNNWYLLTFQAGVWWEGSEIPDGAQGMFGHKHETVEQEDGEVEWIDVALVKTNDEGNVNAIIPTTSGLTGEDLKCRLYDFLFTSGDYTVAIVVKDVGFDPATGGPDLGLLLSGGTPILYEYDLMTFTVE